MVKPSISKDMRDRLGSLNYSASSHVITGVIPLSSMMVLEPRFMFDAAGVATADTVINMSPDTSTTYSSPNSVTDSHGDTTGLLAALANTTILSAADPVSPLAGESEVVFVDPRVLDFQSLTAGVKPGIEVVFLDSKQDGVIQISSYLKSHTAVSSIYIFSHGSAGSITIGSTTLDALTIDQRSNEISAWSSSLTINADILLYGCDVAASSLGSSFIGRLAQTTGADVAASTDATGAARLGGNWILERNTGQIEAKSPLTEATMSGYDALMAAPANTIPGAQTTVEDTVKIFSPGNGNAISVADADGGSLNIVLTSTNGILNLAGTAGLTGLSGNGSSTVSFGGTIAVINTALNGLQFTPTLNYSGAASVQIDTFDETTHDIDTVAITVTPNATAPIFTLPATAQSVSEDFPPTSTLRGPMR